MHSPKISVIIPVYNVEQYIGRCIHALCTQTLDDMELIFVDDGSTDNSSATISMILEEYPHRKRKSKIITHEYNKGVAAARTSGMKVMTGEYMANCDPDDIPAPEMFLTMYETGKTSDADIVSCDYIEDPGGSIHVGTRFRGSGLEALQNHGYTYGLWDKIIRTTIIRENDIYPFQGIDYNEDLNVIVRSLCYCQRVDYVESALYYHTIGRDGSICSCELPDLLRRHSVPCLKALDDFLDNYGRDTDQPEFSSELTNPVKFWMKSKLLQSHNYDLWCKLWPECHSIIPSIPTLGIKERMFMTLLPFRIFRKIVGFIR